MTATGLPLGPIDIQKMASRKGWFSVTRSAACFLHVSTGSSESRHLQAARAECRLVLIQCTISAVPSTGTAAGRDSTHQLPTISSTVSASMIIACTVAGISGAMIPLILKKLGADPWQGYWSCRQGLP